MAVSLFFSSAKAAKPHQLCILAGYEDGRVVMFRYNGSQEAATTPPTARIEPGQNWTLAWEQKGHREARE